MSTTRVPKAKIIRAQKLADELLAIWQADIRPYCDQDKRLSPISIDNDVHDVARIFRRLRQQVEAGEETQ